MPCQGIWGDKYIGMHKEIWWKYDEGCDVVSFVDHTMWCLCPTQCYFMWGSALLSNAMFFSFCEVGCCAIKGTTLLQNWCFLWLCRGDDGMMCNLYLSIYLSLYLSIYLSTYLSTYWSIDLSVYLSIYLPIDLSTYRSIDLSIYRSIDLSIYRSIDLSIYLSFHPSICLSIYLSTYLSIYLSIYLPTHTDIYTHALSLAGLGVHVSSLSDLMNASLLVQVDLSQNSIHCFFFLGLGKGGPS